MLATAMTFLTRPPSRWRQTLRSASTLRFRGRAEVERDLHGHGFDVAEVREAPDRPGKEHVFLARRR